MKNKKVRCYVYIRVSTTMQVDGYSLDAQRDKLRKYAEYQNMEIVQEFADEGKSGKSVEDRPEFQRMLDNIESGTDNIQFVLVFKLSRFGRNAADVLNSLQRMQDFGVNLDVYKRQVYTITALLFKNPLPAAPILFLHIIYSNMLNMKNDIYYMRPFSIMVRFPGRFFETHVAKMSNINQIILVISSVILVCISVTIWKRRRVH